MSAETSTTPAGRPPLRTWQRRALTAYLTRRPRDFLAVATPGAGKTTLALRVAAELLADGTVAALTVVTPTEHLKTQGPPRRPGLASRWIRRSATPTVRWPATSPARW